MNEMPEPFVLRPAVDADRDAIAEVWHSSASLPGVGPPVMPTRRELRDRADLEFAVGWSVTVAVRGDEIIGFVAIKPRQAVLDQLFVRPGSVGCGVGRALLADAIAAMPHGFTLLTRASNTRARRFYEQAGLIALRDDFHPRSGDPVTYYAWNIR